MSDKAAAALEKMAVIQALNLQIVAARKRGDESEMNRLKAQVQALLLSAASAPAAPPEAAATPAGFSAPPNKPSPTVHVQASAASAPTQAPAQSTNQPTNAGDSLCVIAALREVNLAIVAARQDGDGARVQRLKAEAQRLIELGMQQR